MDGRLWYKRATVETFIGADWEPHKNARFLKSALGKWHWCGEQIGAGWHIESGTDVESK